MDEVALSFAEVKMLATGDERFKEKMDLDIQVSSAIRDPLSGRSYVYTNEISIGAGNEITNPILPMGIINDTDTYAIENSNVAEVVDQWTYDEDGYKDQRIVTIKGKKGQEGKETNLVITTDLSEENAAND